MIDRELAQKLNVHVNTASTNEAYLAYVDHRIDQLKEQLTIERDPDEVKRCQGAIKELRSFYTLKDEIKQHMKKP